MGLPIPSAEPTSLTAGTSWRWDRCVPEFPPSEGWALTYHFAGPASIVVAAGANPAGDGYQVRAIAATHAAATAGSYSLSGIATKGDDAHVVYAGRVEIAANPATRTGDTRTHAERMVARLEEALAGREVPEFEEYQINGRSAKYASRTELIAELTHWQNEVRKERLAGRGGGVPLVIRHRGGFRGHR